MVCPKAGYEVGHRRDSILAPTSSRNHNALQANISKNYNDALISHETYASHVANSEQTLN